MHENPVTLHVTSILFILLVTLKRLHWNEYPGIAARSGLVQKQERGAAPGRRRILLKPSSKLQTSNLNGGQRLSRHPSSHIQRPRYREKPPPYRRRSILHAVAHRCTRLIGLDRRSLHPHGTMPRLLLPLVAVAALVPYAHAGIKWTSPEAGDTLTAGTTLTAKWSDDGDSPKIADLATYELFLCAGGNAEGSNVSPATSCDSIAVTPCA